MITIRDVARRAGVSVATVSRVLNNSALVSPDTRDVVMKAVTQLGYRPNANARALATSQRYHRRGGDGRLRRLLRRAGESSGYRCSAASEICADRQQLSRGGKERHAIEVLIRQRCSALIVHSKALSDDELSDFMQHIPGWC